MAGIKCCEDCIHFELCAICVPPLPICDRFKDISQLVEVVRCKDCKYYEIHKPKVLENCERNGCLIPMKPDDFCSYGKKII